MDNLWQIFGFSGETYSTFASVYKIKHLIRIRFDFEEDKTINGQEFF